MEVKSAVNKIIPKYLWPYFHPTPLWVNLTFNIYVFRGWATPNLLTSPAEYFCLLAGIGADNFSCWSWVHVLRYLHRIHILCVCVTCDKGVCYNGAAQKQSYTRDANCMANPALVSLLFFIFFLECAKDYHVDEFGQI